MQGADTTRVLCSDVGLCLRKFVQNLRVSTGEDGRQKGCQSSGVSSVGVRLCLEQNANESHVAAAASELKGGLVTSIGDIHLEATHIKEHLNHLGVPALHGMMQDRISVWIEESLLAVGQALRSTCPRHEEGLHRGLVPLTTSSDKILDAHFLPRGRSRCSNDGRWCRSLMLRFSLGQSHILILIEIHLLSQRLGWRRGRGSGILDEVAVLVFRRTHTTNRLRALHLLLRLRSHCLCRRSLALSLCSLGQLILAFGDGLGGDDCGRWCWRSALNDLANSLLAGARTHLARF
mmetsp:Transcript_80495/g.260700  ORF Transcript_80495/g.260700 Transcript_80495/m.260700 type:complete len:291 (-) Transcript_80495:40-912(-)